MNLTKYVYKAVAHIGHCAVLKCGYIDAYSQSDAENDVVEILLRCGSSDLTDFIVFEAKILDKKCNCVEKMYEPLCFT